LRTALLAYEACAVDIYRAFGTSLFIGSILLLYYFGSMVFGLLCGALVYEFLDPLLTSISLVLPITADLVLEIGTLGALLYCGSSLTCTIARLLVRAMIYLCFEMRGNALFYLLVLATFACTATVGISAVLPPILSEDTLIAIAGLSGLGVLIFGTMTVWLYVRYRWPANPRSR
jgi:hypothetical protein